MGFPLCNSKDSRAIPTTANGSKTLGVSAGSAYRATVRIVRRRMSRTYLCVLIQSLENTKYSQMKTQFSEVFHLSGMIYTDSRK